MRAARLRVALLLAVGAAITPSAADTPIATSPASVPESTRISEQAESNTTRPPPASVQSGNCVARPTEVPRQLRCQIVFSPAFRAAPVVAVGGGSRLSNSKMPVTVRDITTTGMTIEILLEPGQVADEVGASWIAIEP